MENNNQIKENAEKDVGTEQNVVCCIPENCKNASLEKILKSNKINFKCNFVLKHA